MITVTTKYPESLIHQLDTMAKGANVTRAALLREAAETLVHRRGSNSVASRFAHLRGKYQGGPKDGATNPKHLDQFGE